MVYTTRRFILCLTLCYFVLVFFSPFSIAIISLREEKANLSAFRTFVRFVFVWFCRFPLHLGVWEGLRFVIVALPRIFSYRFLVARNMSPTVPPFNFVLKSIISKDISGLDLSFLLSTLCLNLSFQKPYLALTFVLPISIVQLIV